MREKKWTSVWGNAISVSEILPANYAKDITLRYPLYLSLAGESLRFTFSNFCGTEPVTIARITAARSDEKGNLTEEDAFAVLFDGREELTLRPQESAVSDAVPLRVRPGETVSVSVYLRDYTQLRSGVLVTGPRAKGFFSLGDRCADRVLPPKETKSTQWFYFLSTVDALTGPDTGCIVCYGDSITAQDWPDYMAIQMGDGQRSIVRKAVSGTRVLREYDCITYLSYGMKGEKRFRRELEELSGVEAVIIQQGINDIIHPVGVEVNPFRPWSDLPTAQELIDGLRAYIEIAREKKLKVYLGTLLPIEGWRTYAPFREELKNAVNDWIRTTDEIDGCIDFDRLLRDPDKPAAFAPGYDSGDHLHPSKKAYEQMGILACQKVREDSKVHTELVKAEDEADEALFSRAAHILRSGGLVAFPTETVYGLGANALDETAAVKIYAAKGRPSDNPLIVHISREEELYPLVTEIPETARKLMDAFWPGPLTLIMKKSRLVPYRTTGGLDTVAIRMPAHKTALKLIEAAKMPIAAPSANASGRPSPTRAQHVLEDLDGRVDLILDGGDVGIGVESTIVDVTGTVPMILRPGYVTKEMLEQAVGPVQIDPAVLAAQAGHMMQSGEAPKAPGMKYRHYAPKAPMTLVQGEEQAVQELLRRLASEARAEGKTVGILCARAQDFAGQADRVYAVGTRTDTQQIARRLYGLLRQCDRDGVEVIFADSFGLEQDRQLGYAIWNRLLKAAGGRVVKAHETV